MGIVISMSLALMEKIHELLTHSRLSIYPPPSAKKWLEWLQLVQIVSNGSNGFNWFKLSQMAISSILKIYGSLGSILRTRNPERQSQLDPRIMADKKSHVGCC